MLPNAWQDIKRLKKNYILSDRDHLSFNRLKLPDQIDGKEVNRVGVVFTLEGAPGRARHPDRSLLRPHPNIHRRVLG
jgi:hypothetical protein